MNKIIGGLLVVSLLSRPTVFDVDYLAYKMFCTENKIIVVIKSDSEEKNRRERAINTIMANISENGRSMRAQLKEKTRVFAQIQTNMDLRRYAGMDLREDQMDAYAGFMRFAEEENRTFSSALQRLDAGKDLSAVKKELLHNDADYDLIYDELSEINARQQEALASLDSIVERGSHALSLLEFA